MPVGGCQWLNGESNLVAGSVNQWRHVVKGIDRDKGKVREALVACVTNVVGLRLPTVVGDADVRFCRQIQHHAKCDGNEPDKVKKLFHVAMIMHFGECASVTAYFWKAALTAASQNPQSTLQNVAVALHDKVLSSQKLLLSRIYSLEFFGSDECSQF